IQKRADEKASLPRPCAHCKRRSSLEVAPQRSRQYALARPNPLRACPGRKPARTRSIRLNLQQSIPVHQREYLQPSRLEYARVVDQNVASAESSQRPGHRHRNTLGLGDIAFQGQGCPALLLNLFTCLRAPIPVRVNANGRSADGPQLDPGPPAIAPCRPCYDANPIAQPKPVSIVRAHKFFSFSARQRVAVISAGILSDDGPVTLQYSPLNADMLIRRRTAMSRLMHRSDHSITSSARAMSVAGTSRPSAFAVVRLITRSNLVGCSTGMSAGF